MTAANKVSIFRILLVPVFVGFAAYYGRSVAAGAPDERLRWASVVTFGLTAVSDALDGWLARRLNQRTRLGAILDPLADKLLMFCSVLVLSFTDWPQKFPLWFPLVMISRDVLTVLGAAVIHHTAGHVNIQPHWTGKVATVCQLIAIGWVLLDIRQPEAIWSAGIATIFTFASGMIYLADGIKQLQHSSHA